jgi:hypothetical protein
MEGLQVLDDQLSDTTPQFNIIDTNVPSEAVEKFSVDVLAHIFKYSKNSGTIDLNSEYENILMSKKINIVEYMNTMLGWNDVYDVKCTGVRVRKIDDTMRKKVAQWLTHDDNYYTSAYFYIATPGSLFEVYLLVITGKKNALMTVEIGNLKTELNAKIDGNFTNFQTEQNNNLAQLKEYIAESNENTKEELNKYADAHSLLQSEVAAHADVHMSLKSDISGQAEQVTAMQIEITNNTTAQNALQEQLTNLSILTSETHNNLLEQLSTVEQNIVAQKDLITHVSEQLVSANENNSNQFTKIYQEVEDKTSHAQKMSLEMNEKLVLQLSQLASQLESATVGFENKINSTFNTLSNSIKTVQTNMDTQVAILSNKIEELSSVILPSGGEGYIICK